MGTELKEEFKSFIKELTIEVSKDITIQEFKQVNKQLKATRKMYEETIEKYEETRKKYEETNSRYETILKVLAKKIDRVDLLEKSLTEIKESLNTTTEKDRFLFKELEERKQVDKMILREVKEIRKGSVIAKGIIRDSRKERELAIDTEIDEDYLDSTYSELTKFISKIESEILKYKREKIMINGKFDYKNIYEINKGLGEFRDKAKAIREELLENPQKAERGNGIKIEVVADKIKELAKDINKCSNGNYEIIRENGKELYNNLMIVSDMVMGDGVDER